jgi:hypothetical protein
MKIGDVYVHRTTGAYAVILSFNPDSSVQVRMAKNPDNNDGYVEYRFIQEELDTVEGHLRRNLQEMELKQSLLNEAKKRQEAKDLKDAVLPELVN